MQIYNKTDSIKHVVVAYDGDIAVGCGAFKVYQGDTAEIKRMFVLPEYRGYGIGLKILNEIELWATESDFTAYVLETGKKQPEAIRLYQKAGYVIIKSYGQYKNVENSVCMRKSLNL